MLYPSQAQYSNLRRVNNGREKVNAQRTEIGHRESSTCQVFRGVFPRHSQLRLGTSDLAELRKIHQLSFTNNWNQQTTRRVCRNAEVDTAISTMHLAIESAVKFRMRLERKNRGAQ